MNELLANHVQIPVNWTVKKCRLFGVLIANNKVVY